MNKKERECSVRVKSRDDTATAGEDYDEVNELVEFTKSEKSKEILITIHDDDEWEPDEDFYLDLYDAESNEKLEGADTTSKVTIIDDDKPGELVFAEKRALRHPANEQICKVLVKRVHGCDGKIKCRFKTIELDNSDNTAVPGRDYEETSGVVEFDNGEVEKYIEIPILKREDDEEDTVRDEIFGIKLYDPQPQIVKISKKDIQIVEIVTDAESKRQADSLQQLLDRINREEKTSWGQQFIEACILHPTKNEDG